MNKCTVIIEADPHGWHAIIIDETDAVVFVSDSYVTFASTLEVARDWIDELARLPASA